MTLLNMHFECQYFRHWLRSEGWRGLSWGWKHKQSDPTDSFFFKHIIVKLLIMFTQWTQSVTFTMKFYGNLQVHTHQKPNHNEHSDAHFSKLQQSSSLYNSEPHYVSLVQLLFMTYSINCAAIAKREQEKGAIWASILCFLVCCCVDLECIAFDGKRIANINFFQLLSEQPSKCVPINLSNRVNVKDGKFMKQKKMLQHEKFLFCFFAHLSREEFCPDEKF